MNSTRTAGEPSLDMLRSLGRLLVSTAQLRRLAADAGREQSDAASNWLVYAEHLLEFHARILDAVAVTPFTGFAGEHLNVQGEDGLVIPADAAYVATLSKRVDRHIRIGRLLVVDDEPVLQSISA